MTGPQDGHVQSAREQQLLALLLAAAVGGLDRERLVLGEQAALAVAGHDRGDEHHARRGLDGAAGGNQVLEPGDVRRPQLGFVALRAVLGRQVEHGVGGRFTEGRDERRRVRQITGDRPCTRWLGARPAHERDHVMAALGKCRGGGPADETAGPGDENAHWGIREGTYAGLNNGEFYNAA